MKANRAELEATHDRITKETLAKAWSEEARSAAAEAKKKSGKSYEQQVADVKTAANFHPKAKTAMQKFGEQDELETALPRGRLGQVDPHDWTDQEKDSYYRGMSHAYAKDLYQRSAEAYLRGNEAKGDRHMKSADRHVAATKDPAEARRRGEKINKRI